MSESAPTTLSIPLWLTIVNGILVAAVSTMGVEMVRGCNDRASLRLQQQIEAAKATKGITEAKQGVAGAVAYTAYVHSFTDAPPPPESIFATTLPTTQP